MLSSLPKKKIGIDIDDVIADTVPTFLRYIDEVHGIRFEVEKFTNYKFYELEFFIKQGIDKMWCHNVWNEFSDSKYGKEMPAVNGSIEKIKQLKSSGFEINLVTARWESLRSNTEEWLHRVSLGGFYDKLFFTGNYSGPSTKKSKICVEHEIEFMIEDNLSNCIDLASSNIPCYLFNKPWNTHTKTDENYIKRINNWSEII